MVDEGGAHLVAAPFDLAAEKFAPGGADDEAMILSNNHVLADENRGRQGDRILQPGRLDGGRPPRDVAARLSRFVRLKQRGNTVDAAVAEVQGGIEYFYDWIEGLGAITGVRVDALDDGAGEDRCVPEPTGCLNTFGLNTSRSVVV